jgi:hypothetical protein
MQVRTKIITGLLLVLFLSSSIIFSQPSNKSLKQSDFFKNHLTSTPLIIDSKKLDANSISAWINNDGEFFSESAVTGPGFEWPKGSGLHAIFSSGIWLGAKIQDCVRVAAAGHFFSEYRPGMIINGVADDFTKPQYRCYKVRPLFDTPGSNPDYAEWPTAQGAPYHDIDGNGSYNPIVDKPALVWGNSFIYPDMLMYSVFNDADSQFHTIPWGKTKPLGAEVRQTTWAFNRPGYLDQTIFMRFEIINKSEYTWDSTYIAYWTDPDLGDAFDDVAGVDTNYGAIGKSNTAFCYNYDNVDGPPGYGYAPPAVGFKVLQGPVFATGNYVDTALWSGKKRAGYKNLDASSFSYFCNYGSAGCAEGMNDPRNYLETYNVLKGYKRDGTPYYCPDGKPTKFPLAWPLPPSWPILPTEPIIDVRMAYKTGPLTLAPNDTQQVIYAVIVGRGISNINSVEVVRSYSSQLDFIKWFGFNFGPKTEISENYQTPNSTSVTIQVTEPRASSITVSVKAWPRPPVYAESLVATIILYDDGLHWDGIVDDGIFGNQITLDPNRNGYFINLNVNYKDGSNHLWQYVSGIRSFGPLKISSTKFASDNINQDGKINPGENVRLTLGVKNGSKFYLDDLSVRVRPINTEFVRSSGNIIPVDITLCPFCTYEKPYDSANDSSYFSVDVDPNTPPGYQFKMLVDLDFSGFWYENTWKDTLTLQVEENNFQPRLEYPHHSDGIAEGTFGIRLVDSSAIKDNFYRITIERPLSGETLLNLENLNTNQTLLEHNPLPDPLGHLIPVTDGFRITRGNVTTSKGIRQGEYIPGSNRWFSGVTPSYNPDVATLGIYYPRTSNLFSQVSSVSIEDLKTVEIRFSTTNTQRAYRYISGFWIFPPTPTRDTSFIPYILVKAPGFTYQDYELYPLNNPSLGRTAPFTVWEVDHKTGEQRQLNIAIVENNDSLWKADGTYFGKGKIDGKWFPTTHSTGGKELLYIFSSSYSEAPDSFYTNRNLYYNQHEFDIFYVMWQKILNASSNFVDGDTLRITPYYPLKEGDLFTFNPLRLLDVGEYSELPTAFKLYQNYPNPFNPTTTIKYDLPFAGRVQLEIYNILGQRIVKLVDELQLAGYYSKQWDSKSDRGILLASGVYFYKLTLTGNSSTHTHVNKMLLLK